MRLRKMPYVMHIHASKRKEAHEQFYTKLSLFCPFQNKATELPFDEKECLKSFNADFILIKVNRQKILPFAD